MRVARAGFPVRYTHEQFASRYAPLARPRRRRPRQEDDNGSCSSSVRCDEDDNGLRIREINGVSTIALSNLRPCVFSNFPHWITRLKKGAAAAAGDAGDGGGGGDAATEEKGDDATENLVSLDGGGGGDAAKEEEGDDATEQLVSLDGAARYTFEFTEEARGLGMALVEQRGVAADRDQEAATGGENGNNNNTRRVVVAALKTAAGGGPGPATTLGVAVRVVRVKPTLERT